jgi:asparagine N-glycosylation enzyme membrane subunit Stt3
MKKIETLVWALLCVMMTVNFAWMAFIGHSWSAVVSGILLLIFYRMVVLTIKENRG